MFSNSFVGSQKSLIVTQYIANTYMLENLDPSCTVHHPIPSLLVVNYTNRTNIFMLLTKMLTSPFAEF
jgi:hypothetical protein